MTLKSEQDTPLGKRSKRTGESQGLTPRQDGVGRGESGSALEFSGLERVGSTTSLITQTRAHLESLKDLERKAQTLESRFYEACVMLNIATGHLVGQRRFTIDTTTIRREYV